MFSFDETYSSITHNILYTKNGNFKLTNIYNVEIIIFCYYKSCFRFSIRFVLVLTIDVKI